MKLEPHAQPAVTHRADQHEHDSGELPNGWASTTLGDITHINPPGATVAARDDTLVSFLPMAAVEELTGRINTSDKRPFGKVKKGFTRFRNGDILFAKITPSMENGKIAIARDLHGGIGCGTTEFHVIRPHSGIDAKYIRYFLLRDCYRRDAKRNMSGAVGQQRVPADFLRLSDIPLAPENEQGRITDKIDELFSRIEVGEDALNRAKTLAERYRKSLLKAAVTGELTRDWREKNKGKIESADKLLECILKARRDTWEKSELAKMQAKGISTRDSEWKKRYREPPAAVPSANIPELPNGWTYASMNQLAFIETGATPKRGNDRYYRGGSVPWITSAAVNNSLITSCEEWITEAAIRETNAKVFPSGSLIMAMYGEGKTRGKISVLGIDAATNQACAAFLVQHLPTPLIAFIKLYFLYFYQQMRAKAAGGVQPNLNLEIIRDTVLPLPPLTEITEIADRAEDALIIGDKCSEDLRSQIAITAALRQSVLTSAFEGRLVSQESNDESASALLARTKNEHDTSAKIPANRRRIFCKAKSVVNRTPTST